LGRQAPSARSSRNKRCRRIKTYRHWCELPRGCRPNFERNSSCTRPTWRAHRFLIWPPFSGTTTPSSTRPAWSRRGKSSWTLSDASWPASRPYLSAIGRSAGSWRVRPCSTWTTVVGGASIFPASPRCTGRIVRISLPPPHRTRLAAVVPGTHGRSAGVRPGSPADLPRPSARTASCGHQIPASNLTPSGEMSRRRVGLALPVGMRGEKAQWAARPRAASP
jgi:hypothetical protein